MHRIAILVSMLADDRPAALQDVKDVPCIWRVKAPVAELYGLPADLPERLVCTNLTLACHMCLKNMEPCARSLPGQHDGAKHPILHDANMLTCEKGGAPWPPRLTTQLSGLECTCR